MYTRHRQSRGVLAYAGPLVAVIVIAALIALPSLRAPDARHEARPHAAVAAAARPPAAAVVAPEPEATTDVLLAQLRQRLAATQSERTALEAAVAAAGEELARLSEAAGVAHVPLPPPPPSPPAPAADSGAAAAAAAGPLVAVQPDGGSDGTFPPPPRDVSDYDFANTAIVTMVGGNEAARGVVALVQSLRDVNTRVQDIVVILPSGGRDRTDPALLSVLSDKLGAKLFPMAEIPSTQWTAAIPGGRGTFWGFALNKLAVFNMTRYKKLLWMDGDTLVLKNVDHLFLEPMFTAAFTYACCNANGPAIPSGGLWVVEPSVQLADEIWQMQLDGKPKVDDKTGLVVLKPDGTPEREYWHWGDMQIVRWKFSKWAHKSPKEPLWPRVHDDRHGHAPGIKYFPALRNDADKLKGKTSDPWTGQPLPEGLIPGSFDSREPIWRALDARYDQCVGSCECLPERDMPKDFFSLHFSCIHHVHKPGSYNTEEALMRDLSTNALSCTRHYFLTEWYARFVKAAGRLPGPWTGEPVPTWDTDFDAKVLATRKKRLL